MTLTKADLVEAIYKTHDTVTKAEATDAVEAFLRIAKNNLINGSDLLLSGFGKFTVNDKKAPRGRNPAPSSQRTRRRPSETHRVRCRLAVPTGADASCPFS